VALAIAGGLVPAEYEALSSLRAKMAAYRGRAKPFRVQDDLSVEIRAANAGIALETRSRNIR
jgi:hypothetical protein